MYVPSPFSVEDFLVTLGSFIFAPPPFLGSILIVGALLVTTKYMNEYNSLVFISNYFIFFY